MYVSTVVQTPDSMDEQPNESKFIRVEGITLYLWLIKVYLNSGMTCVISLNMRYPIGLAIIIFHR
jgi:hypothetical protein